MSDLNDSLAESPHRVARFRYVGETASLETVRFDASGWAHDLRPGRDDEVVQRLLLVVTELATNAIEAAPGQMFEITLAPVGLRGVSVRVTNRVTGPGLPAAPWLMPSPTASRGRGLPIVAALAEVSVDQTSIPDQVTVRADLAR